MNKNKKSNGGIRIVSKSCKVLKVGKGSFHGLFAGMKNHFDKIGLIISNTITYIRFRLCLS